MVVHPASIANGVKVNSVHNGYPGKPITETISNGFFTVDKRWTVQYWNKAAEELLSVKASDIVGKNLWEVFVENIPINFYAVYHKAFLQDIPVHFEEYWAEMGVWFDVVTYHCNDTLSVSFKNCSQRSPSLYPVQQLKMLNDLYKYVTEVTNDCLWEWDLVNKDIFWIDGGHKRVFGYPIENALIPQSFWESRVHPDDRSRILLRLGRIIQEGNSVTWEDEYRFQCANGGYARVHDRGHIIYDEGKATRMIGATHDITAKKITEAKLLESEKNFSLIATQTINAVIITDPAGKIIWVNSSFTKVTEYAPEEAIGLKPGALLQGKETDPATVRYLRRQIGNKQPFDCEIINYSKSGRRYWVHIQGQALLDEDGNCERYFAIQKDITEKILTANILAQEKLDRQREITDAVLTAQEYERSEIGKELHDNVNQILAVARLYIQMAQTGITNQDVYLKEANDLVINGIEEIRKISKTLVIPNTHIIGLFDNIRNLINDLSRVHPIEIEFVENNVQDKDLSEHLQLNIFRIVQEQFNNILKHAAATHATIELIRHENEVILLISDDGQGSDTDEKRKGVGILNIISRAELCNGTAEIESRPGHGFLLRVILPYADADRL